MGPVQLMYQSLNSPSSVTDSSTSRMKQQKKSNRYDTIYIVLSVHVYSVLHRLWLFRSEASVRPANSVVSLLHVHEANIDRSIFVGIY